MSTNWIELFHVGSSGSFTIVNNLALVQAPSSRSIYWKAFGSNREVYARIVTHPLTGAISVLLRMNDAGEGSLTGYGIYVLNTGTMLRMARFDSASSASIICPDITAAFYPGDSLGDYRRHNNRVSKARYRAGQSSQLAQTIPIRDPE